MQTQTNRRAFIGSVAAFTTLPALSIATSPAPDPIPDLCAEYLRLEPILDDIQARRDDAFDSAVELIGPCDCSTHEANQAWWSAYQRTPAWALEVEWEKVAAEQCGIMDEAVRIPATTYAGVAEKLRLWLASHAVYVDDNTDLIESIISDLEALA
jgi:hypothetical protein